MAVNTRSMSVTILAEVAEYCQVRATADHADVGIVRSNLSGWYRGISNVATTFQHTIASCVCVCVFFWGGAWWWCKYDNVCECCVKTNTSVSVSVSASTSVNVNANDTNASVSMSAHVS